PPPALHSFPTRRSSDLRDREAEKQQGIDPGLDSARQVRKLDMDRLILTLFIPVNHLIQIEHPAVIASGESGGRIGVLLQESEITDRKSTRLNSSHVKIS